ncbi:MAG: hypothetical protein U5R31_05085 [Acidimicrobiia bacterium]|nr:hypothetical protein [Acidimicrobiia bacterium]
MTRRVETAPALADVGGAAATTTAVGALYRREPAIGATVETAGTPVAGAAVAALAADVDPEGLAGSHRDHRGGAATEAAVDVLAAVTALGAVGVDGHLADALGHRVALRGPRERELVGGGVGTDR